MAPSVESPSIFDDATRGPSKPSVLRAFWSPKSHKRNSSADDAFPSKALQRSQPFDGSTTPPDGDGGVYESFNQQPLAEIAPNRESADISSGQRSPGKQGKNILHKKTKSAVSLKSLKNYMERKDPKPEEGPEVDAENLRPKKAKSANSLSAILRRSQRGNKTDGSKSARDKENRSPDSMPTPIWDHFVPPSNSDHAGLSPVPIKNKVAQEEKSHCTPRAYGPTHQPNFWDFDQQPPLTPRTPRTEPKPRPKSDYLAGSRRIKEVLSPLQVLSSDKTATTDAHASSPSKRFGRPRALSRPEKGEKTELAREQNPKVSRVQAAISALNAKEQEADLRKRLNPKELDTEFEKLLDARNIPHNMRDKMRSLDTNIKADFILKDRTENTTPHSGSGSANDSTGRRGRRKEPKEEQQNYDSKGSRSRSRSRGFTLSKGSSSPKKRPDSGSFYRRPKSAEYSLPTGFSKTMTPNASTTSLSATARDTASDPSDFVHYLREIQKPEMVEIGKVHKLRLLLRNETVSWVDMFIADGGMDEIVQLLYRIMKVEWREEHEDNLLHETLLCLKALCTTSIALEHLSQIEGELFPALLKMLFDEDKKGPSEFTTRGIIINLIFTQLSAVSSDEMAAARASRILSYLRDPTPPEENQPLTFIADIYQPRPYRVWCKEVTNVSKEVFWIFLHHLNVIPTPKDETPSSATYRERHFPTPRPPVPAAPYVGGVEWDATNYLAAHLDLLNGIVASLPTTEERNQLRAELRASGFEKVMGGTLRTCKEKFYSSVHDCLRTWVAAAIDDEWPHLLVREGPPRPEIRSSSKSPVKAAGGSPKKGLLDEQPPKLELALDVPASTGAPQNDGIGNWL
ncbi:uncharacterized protein BP01DRAFT_47372 [Aspergillus saccharolyticus JOP 1030-1]|uniref:GTPase binding protein Rid1 n=1 Tax=Aspergillus saccharolyticus JOP 1030-1 TaxID=1450539 RepID=A0A318ZF11_9EURO|nr:GTPase binding protein Rid1 [Aspergillus saccharolyticus JOP 1030-1]PYH45267.1 GTPase binding protein Rid1 [Aspergillus saccharolyticus JOP 1030-1]